jgi:hypothetical protein
VKPGQSTKSAPSPLSSAGGPDSSARVDLRFIATPSLPPLVTASGWASSAARDRPEAEGVRCDQGHFNHPRAQNCLRCGAPIPASTSRSSGPRPPIGVLLADDGSIWVLDRDCLLGADPASTPQVQSGAAQCITMRAGPNRKMAPVQAEIKTTGWTAHLVDRGAEEGTFVQGPGTQGWAQLAPNEQRELASSSHVSFGGRVLTYLSAWPA